MVFEAHDVDYYGQTGCSLASNIAASCSEQIAITLTSCCSNVTLVFYVYYKIKGKFVPQACNICIFRYFKLILNAMSSVRRLERERVYNYK